MTARSWREALVVLDERGTPWERDPDSDAWYEPGISEPLPAYKLTRRRKRFLPVLWPGVGSDLSVADVAAQEWQDAAEVKS